MLYIVPLIILGSLFLVAEVLLLPGVSIGAILSLICYGGAIYVAFDDYSTTVGLITVAVTLVSALITVVVSLRAKTWRKLSLNQSIDSTGVEQPEQSVVVGSRGVAVSRIAPMGKVEIDGKRYEAKSADVFIDQREEVEVIGFENASVVVQKVAK